MMEEKIVQPFNPNDRTIEEELGDLRTFEQVIAGVANYNAAQAAVARAAREAGSSIVSFGRAYSPRHAKGGGKSLHQKAVERRKKRKNGGPK